MNVVNKNKCLQLTFFIIVWISASFQSQNLQADSKDLINHTHNETVVILKNNDEPGGTVKNLFSTKQKATSMIEPETAKWLRLSKRTVNSTVYYNTKEQDISRPEGVDFEKRESSLLLDGFFTGKRKDADGSNILPIFFLEPESVYVIKNRPALLKCKAAHALQLFFKCSGSSQPPPSKHEKHVDPHTGVHFEEVTATIHRDLVEEYFGKGSFKCECQAWSSRGVVKSHSAVLNIAYIRKQFPTSPMSMKIEIGSPAELHCEPPSGFPEPKITWYKNNIPLAQIEDSGVSISSKGSLIFQKVSLQHMANYSCIAENIAGKRISDSAVLIVYVNGGWSSWSFWKECKCSGGTSRGRKRFRYCNNPAPLNGGSPCIGPSFQKSVDCISCPGLWSAWSDWSSCSADCIQVRHRKCISSDTDIIIDSKIGTDSVADGSEMDFSLLSCTGKNIQTAECRGELCDILSEDFDWTLYIGLGIITIICFAFGTTLLCYSRRGIRSQSNFKPPKNNICEASFQDAKRKMTDIQFESVNISYDYASPNSQYVPNEKFVKFEHHYDLPNSSKSYMVPFDDQPTEYISSKEISPNFICNEDESAFKAENMPAEYKEINNDGGNLNLYNNEIMLYIPEQAVGRNVGKQISLRTVDDESLCASISNNESFLICSTVITSSPDDYSFLKPVVLKIPHCLKNPDLWNVAVFYANRNHACAAAQLSWHKVTVIGEETINTPIFVQMESDYAYIMTEQLGSFFIAANLMSCKLTPDMSIKMRLIAYGQMKPNQLNYSLRIYVVKDLPNSINICNQVETQLGGTYMGQSQCFTFLLNNSNLYIRLSSSTLADDDDADGLDEHIIPYNHVLSNNPILHCEFITKRFTDECESIGFDIQFSQCVCEQLSEPIYSFPISNQNISHLNRQSIVSINKQGNYVNDTNILNIVKLPFITKQLICTSLDPPRKDGRDWRLLAKRLNTDRYIAYFATKASPTEQILNLWECRANSSSNSIVQLLMILNDLNREDIIKIISDSIEPLWL